MRVPADDVSSLAGAAVTLARLAGTLPAVALAQVVSDRRPTELATSAELRAFARRHRLAVINTAELAALATKTPAGCVCRCHAIPA